MRLAAAPLLFALAVLVAPASAQVDPSKETPRLEPADLEGVYEIVSGEKFGEAEPTERIKGSTVRFTRDRVVVMDKESKEVYGATYALIPDEGAAGEAASGAKGSKIRMVSKLVEPQDQESTSEGMIERDGDKVRLIYALPDAEAPREFKTKAGQLMFVLQRKAAD
ncbi:hypothetical protein [Paludisphaera sp.]|uniref:hypothetical protein n=1 Tax=Paludisphaera sp. TaxID=2017432 RepID=UPI00301E5F17